MLDLARRSILVDSLIFIFIGLYLTYLVSSNLARPFEEMIRVLRSISNGNLDETVRVTSNDEIGYTGDVINEMARGLKEREQMRHSLALAREVQQNLLPKAPPTAAGLDMAGRSIYCEQTGGDYFDYLEMQSSGDCRYALVVGDVSGHGISAALLMATVRAFLRLRAFMPGGIAEVIADVNRHLVRDVEDSGQFMTLFYLVMEPDRRRMAWVRAGHDPALFFDPAENAFATLSGRGIALGIDDSARFERCGRENLAPGQVIVMGTDGIWEARNAAGEMFGKSRIREIIRTHHRQSAQEMVDAIVHALKSFQTGVESADDITLVVVRITR